MISWAEAIPIASGQAARRRWRLGRDQSALRTGIDATEGASRHGYAAGNIGFATKGIGSIVMPPAPPAGFTRPVEFEISWVGLRPTSADRLTFRRA